MKTRITNISETASLVAKCRSWESHQVAPLFVDKLADLLIREDDKPLLRQFVSEIFFPVFATAISIRTKLIDDILLQLINEKKVIQIINIGCGLDTRPYRLKLPNSLTWWELDKKKILDFKSEVLYKFKPACKVIRRSMDLMLDFEIKTFLDHEINSNLKTAILTEGLLVYLDPRLVKNLLQQCAQKHGFSYWITDIATSANKGKLNAGRYSLYRELLQHMHFFAQENDSIFLDNGWKQSSSFDLALEAIRFKRPLTVESPKDVSSRYVSEIKSLMWSGLSYIILLRNHNLKHS